MTEGKLHSESARRQQIGITGPLLVPDALPAWELQLVLPVLGRLLAPAVGRDNTEEADRARPG